MSTRIGLAVGRSFVRAVAIRKKRVVWAGEAPLPSLEDLQATIASLLAEAPLHRWSRPVVSAAIGPHASQVKRVVGLPNTNDPGALAAIIREAVGTYFLKNGVSLITTGVRLAGTGAAVAAALDRPYVAAVREACRARGYRLGPIAPTAVALTHALVDPSFQWNDGPLTIEVTRTGSALDSVRTRPARRDDESAAQASTVPALAVLGTDSMRYADAFGATALDAREPLAVTPDATKRISLAVPSRALIMPGLILAAGVVGVGLSPLATRWVEHRARANVEQIRPGRWQVISTARGQLDHVSAVLRQSRSFAESRTSIGRLLGELARLLPEGSALLGFEWIDDRGEVTVVTANPAAVLSALRRLPEMRSVELVGSVTRQSVGGQDLQRVTIRFKRTP